MANPERPEDVPKEIRKSTVQAARDLGRISRTFSRKPSEGIRELLSRDEELSEAFLDGAIQAGSPDSALKKE